MRREIPLWTLRWCVLPQYYRQLDRRGNSEITSRDDPGKA